MDRHEHHHYPLKQPKLNWNILMENESIALVQSRAFWAATLALVAVVAKQFHWADVTAFVVDPHSVETILGFVAMAGSVGAIIFRAAATKTVTSVLPAKK